MTRQHSGTARRPRAAVAKAAAVAAAGVAPAALEFRLRPTSFSFQTNPLQQQTVAINVEGPVEKYGLVMGTFSCQTPERKAGAWHWCGVSFPETGISYSSVGHGTYEKASANTWRTLGAITMSDGRIHEVDGLFDIAGKLWRGRLS